MTFDPLLAKFVLAVGKGIKRISKFICCMKADTPEMNPLPQATTNSSPGMLTLSIYLNHLITWVITVFSVSLASNYLASDNTVRYLGILTASNAVISCISGFWISSYLIKKLEESLSFQILTVFNTSNDSIIKHSPRHHIEEKESAMSKVVVMIILISLAFAICISTVLQLVYKDRLTTLFTFLLASMVDVLVLRPLVIFIDSVCSYTGIIV